jgi:hypothetical protein
MPSRRIAILGSCVSADIFRLNPDAGELVSYHARSSLLSVMSPPLDLHDETFEWTSGFARREVKADFEKTFFKDIRKANCDLLLIDFVDERWDLLRTQQSFVTRSADLLDARIEQSASYGFERVARLEHTTQLLWRDACARFAIALQENLPNVRVVLHRVMGAGRYRNSKGVHDLQPFADGIPLKALRATLEDCYDFFLARFPGAAEIALPPNVYVAEESHRWGLSPFHFEDRYYWEVAEILRTF